MSMERAAGEDDRSFGVWILSGFFILLSAVLLASFLPVSTPWKIVTEKQTAREAPATP